VDLANALPTSTLELREIAAAVAIRRGLADARPNEFRPDPASALHTLSNRFPGLGRRREALSAFEERTALYRSLARARPLAFCEALATVL
jgi:hypothetical protein